MSIRKLVAVDMAWLGAPIILTEYALGILLPLILGFVSLRFGFLNPAGTAWEKIFGLWLGGIGANYIPMLLYAISIARRGTLEQEGRPELAHAKRYGIQQGVLLVPLVVDVMALIQEQRKHNVPA
jgi:hypothetical protein